MRILIVEDDELTAAALETLFSVQNYAVEWVKDGQQAAELVDAFEYDLVLSDVRLPGLDGISFCRQLRSQGHQMPILLLTGQDSGHDKVLGLDAGADDYVVKPFDPEELAARVRALLRRGDTTKTPILKWGQLKLDPSACEVTYRTQFLPLTPKEYALLELLMRHNRRVFSCGMVLEHLWTYEDAPGEEAVRTHVKGLRQKLKAVGAPQDAIETVYGIGYRLKPLSESETKNSETSVIRAEQTLKTIASVWQKFQPRVDEQVRVLESAAASLGQDMTDLERAQREAHTLAGSLGTFGLSGGSEIARKIEQLLSQSPPFNAEQIQRIEEQITELRQVINLHPHKDEQTLPMDNSFVLIVDGEGQGNHTSCAALEQEAKQRQFPCQAVPHLMAAQDLLQHQTPKLVLLDPNLADEQSCSAFLTNLAKRTPPIPVLMFTAQDSLTQRVRAAHLGGQAFVSKSLPAAQIWDAIQQALYRSEAVEAQVMMVDDDPQILDFVTSLLLPWGLVVTPLSDPQKFWQTLTVSQPELLILDIEMPQFDGLELCQVVRNDLDWGDLPVIFLTAHTEPEVINQVFAAGADDFVNKPIVGPELVVRVLNRLERTRLQRRLHGSPHTRGGQGNGH